MKHRLGFVIAVGMGLWSQATAYAQQPAPLPAPPAPPPAAPPAAPSSDKPATGTAAASADKPADGSVAGQTDPNAQPAPQAPEPTPNAPPAPPPAGASTSAPAVPPPVTLPPYLTGGPSPLTVLPPVAPQTQAPPPPPPGPGADAGVTPKKKPAYLRWRGSGISWNHSVSATALGVGKDYISDDDQQYAQGLSGTFNYFLIEPKDAKGNKRGYNLRVQTSLGFDVELTNSDSTTDKYEKQLRDIPISFVYNRTLWSGPNGAGIAMNLNGTTIFPTSPISRGQGVYLSVNPRAALFFNVPLRGKDADFLQSVFLGLGTQYTHRFTEAETPTNSSLRRIRTGTTPGSTIVSDQLTGRSIDSNNFRIGGFAFFSEKLFGGDLWIFAGGGASYQFVNQFESAANGCDLVISTGCTQAQRLDDPLAARVIADFSVGLNYFPNADWGIGLGYDNAAGQLAPDGKWRNPFNSPNAQFNASLIISVDSIVEHLQGSHREEPVIFFGQNKKKPQVQQNAAMQALF